MRLLHRAAMNLCPPGDAIDRKSIYDAVAAGSIPVFTRKMPPFVLPFGACGVPWAEMSITVPFKPCRCEAKRKFGKDHGCKDEPFPACDPLEMEAAVHVLNGIPETKVQRMQQVLMVHREVLRYASPPFLDCLASQISDMARKQLKQAQQQGSPT
jgi:hypothetical protein